ncbi:MAG: MBOAT family protein, partial [Spirochaetia bacterium]|nr:MBOAT family protein [Spirochaetia bacterium]
MLFNSIDFLIFFPIILILGNILKGTTQKLLLLFASFYFYMAWNRYFIFLILASTLLDYFVALYLDSTPIEKITKRKWILSISMIGNLGFLAYFKYTNFLIGVVNDINFWGGENIALRDITLPVGISFYTFQSMSYTIDVYRKQLDAKKSFIDFSLYVAFFPQLVAGPIVRATTFFRDLEVRLPILNEDIQVATTRILIGFVRKIVFADNLAIIVDHTFLFYHTMSPLEIWTGVIAFGWQIYFDFAGYTDIAIGVARLFGFKFDPNFNFPMSTNSITDHWSKWHISFSTWIRDYIYIPLGGSRGGELITYRNLFITWFFAGVWHGAAYHYIAWGLWQGVMIGIHRFYSKTRISKILNENGGNFYDIFCRVFTMFCLSFGFTMFRAENMVKVREIISSMLFLNLNEGSIFDYSNWRYGVLLFICFTASTIFSKRNIESMSSSPFKLMMANTVSIFLLLFFGFESTNFLYFQF